MESFFGSIEIWNVLNVKRVFIYCFKWNEGIFCGFNSLDVYVNGIYLENVGFVSEFIFINLFDFILFLL